MSLWTWNPTPCFVSPLFHWRKPCVFLCCCFTKALPFHFTESKDVHLYLSITCVSSWCFPAALSVLVFLVPMVMSLPRIWDGALVACLTPPSWCTAEGVILVNLGGKRSGMIRLSVVMSWWLKGKRQPDRVHPSPGRTCGHWVHHGTLPPTGPSIWTMKRSAQWCFVHTSCFTKIWEMHGGQERLIPSRIPLDQPTLDSYFSKRWNKNNECKCAVIGRACWAIQQVDNQPLLYYLSNKQW